MMKFKFKSFVGNKASHEEDQGISRYEKRKDQVRKAQRTHRERKEAYVRSLEAEVKRLRKSEQELLWKTSSLNVQVTQLKDALRKSGIAVLQDEGYVSNHEKDHDAFEIEIHNGVAAGGNQRSISACRVLPLPASTQQVPAAHVQPIRHYTPAASLQPDTPPKHSEYSLDLTAVGLSFILSLEEPCLPHVLADTQAAPTNHELTLTSALIDHNIRSTPTQPQGSETELTWRLPSLEIDRLLELSRTMPLRSDEITPVQAWDLVRRFISTGNMPLEKLEALRRRLRAAVVCEGFGGVLNVDAFDDVMFEVFAIDHALQRLHQA